MTITHKINMDLGRRGMLPRIDAVQGDSYTRILELSLYENSVPWNIPEGASVRMRYRKPDGTGGYYDSLPDDALAWEADGNVLWVTLAPQMLTVPGLVVAQAEIVQGQSVLSTFSFSVVVERDPAAGALESEDYIKPLEWMKEQIDEHTKEVIGGAAASAEAAAQSASNSQTSANLSAQSAASARGAAEEAKQAAEEAKQVDTLASTAAASAAQAAASESSAWASADQADTSAREAKQAAEEAKQAAEEAKQAADGTGNTGSTVNVTELAMEMAAVYTWEQWDADPNAGVRKKLWEPDILDYYGGGMAGLEQYSYADALTLVNGKLALENPMTATDPTVADDLYILRGKYMQSISGLIYIPENEEFWLQNNKWQVSNAYLITDAARIGIAASDSPYAYPNEGEMDGFWYIASRQRGEKKEGSGYTLTAEDKQEIAEQAAALVDTALLDIIGTGVVE